MTDTRTIIKTAPGSESDKMFEGAINAILHMDKKDYPSYIGGLKIASGTEYIVKSPIDESIQFGRFQEPEDGLQDRAVEVAANAFVSWSKTESAKRAGFVETALDEIKRQRYRLAAAVTISSGMVRNDSLYEVDRLIEVLEDGIEKTRKGLKSKPIGVWAVICEHNSPLASPAGYALSAILAGNTVVLVPSNKCPLPVYMIYEILSKALLPDGVLNVMFDRRGKATRSLADNGGLVGIVASGSSAGFEEIMFGGTDESVRFINEMKGMNPILIHRPHSMPAAAKAVVRSAFGFSGQRLDSCSKVIVTVNEQKAFIDGLLSALGDMKVGDPADFGTDVGPVISKDAMDEMLKIVDSASDYLIFGGKRVTSNGIDAGYYVMPAVFMGLPSDHELNEIDHGLPILTVKVVADLNEAIEEVNSCEYGLGSGIFAKDERVIERFLDEAISDTVFVNCGSDDIGHAVKADVKEFLK